MIERARRPPAWVEDVLVAAVFAVAWFGAYDYWRRHGWMPQRPETYQLAGLWTTAVLLSRRRAPLVVMAATAVGYPLLYDGPLITEFHLLPVLVAAYGVTGLRRGPAAGGSVAALGSVLYLSTVTEFGRPNEVDRVLLNLLATLAVVGLGVLVHSQRRTAASLAARNEELERLRQVAAEQATAAERTRIARELHDVIAHHLTAVVVRGQAALRVAPDDPQVGAETLAWVVETTREALTSTRQTVKVLRGDDPSLLQPLPGLGDLTEIVGRIRETGLAVDLDVADDLPRLDPQVELALLRISQEALTNVLRHARAALARVTIATVDGRGVELSVDDDGSGRRPTGPPRGHGLVGMQERAVSCGGRLDVGRSPLGGWRVRALLPIRPPDVGPGPGPAIGGTS